MQSNVPGQPRMVKNQEPSSEENTDSPFIVHGKMKQQIKQHGRSLEINYKPQIRMFFYQTALLAYKVVPAETVIGRVISG